MDYLIAVVAAVLLGAGFVLQQDAAQQAPTSEFLRLRLIGDLLRKPRWLAGLVTMAAGQLLSAWVIGHLVLSLAEPLLATNLLFALLLAGPISRQPVHKSEIIGAVVLMAGVSVLSLARTSTSPQVSVGSSAYWPYATAAIALCAAACAEAGRRGAGSRRATVTGLAAGLVFGIQDAVTRRTIQVLNTHHVVGLLTTWPPYTLFVVGVVGLWLMESAFNAAPLHASLPAITAAEPVAGIVLGIVVFGDRVHVSPEMIALQVAGLVALVAGVILVARAPALTGARRGSQPASHRPAAPLRTAGRRPDDG